MSKCSSDIMMIRRKINNNHLYLDEEQLILAVKNQIEYYFSKENLRTDAFLTSQMDANSSAPLSVVMKVRKKEHKQTKYITKI
jgi:hypothetical protein